MKADTDLQDRIKAIKAAAAAAADRQGLNFAHGCSRQSATQALINIPTVFPL